MTSPEGVNERFTLLHQRLQMCKGEMLRGVIFQLGFNGEQQLAMQRIRPALFLLSE